MDQRAIAMASQQPPPTLPLPPANLLLAYEARNAGNTYLSGRANLVTDFGSGASRHATQGTAGNRPLDSTTGGHKSLLFAVARPDWMSIASLTVAAGIKTLYVVVDPVTIDTSPRILFGNSPTLVGAINGQYAASDGTWRQTGVALSTGRQRLTFEMSSAGGLRFWRNGVQATTQPWTTNPAFSGAAFFGAAFFGGTWPFGGHVEAMYLYGAARDANVGAYITQEFGV